jgi:2-succinyl-5-enolpyruvyl-6-hydroxy-3-cyclohexene-1-carboxylate synthase
LIDALEEIYAKNEKPFILEVFTPTKENEKVLIQYFKELV